MAELEINPVENNTTVDASIANKPTKKDIENFKVAFENAAKEFQNKLWQIADEKEAWNTLEYLNDFIKNRAIWMKDSWMGMIKINEVIEDSYKNFEKNKPLFVTYQALEFLAYIMQNGVSGIGVASAEEFEKIAEKHIKIMGNIFNVVKEARELIKEIQFKQDQWISAEQGFFLEKEDFKKDE